jgi:hypothetical protein
MGMGSAASVPLRGTAPGATPRTGSAPTASSRPSTAPGGRTTSSPGSRTPGPGVHHRLSRMLEEATGRGPRIVGVVDTSPRWPTWACSSSGPGHRGDGWPTARRRPDGRPWTTYLAGQRLAKLVEAGLRPGVIAASVASVRVWAYCVTEYLTEGSNSMYSGPSPGPRSTRRSRPTWWSGAWPASHGCGTSWARLPARGGDGHHRALGEGDADIQCILRGNRVRRFKEFDPCRCRGPRCCCDHHEPRQATGCRPHPSIRRPRCCGRPRPWPATPGQGNAA